jgi:hypothetical protein
MKKRTIAMLILLVIAIIMIPIYDSITGKAVASTSVNTCSDTDGGATFHISGRVYGQQETLYKNENFENEDSCINNKTLMECYCVTFSDLTSKKKSMVHECSVECKDGACTTEEYYPTSFYEKYSYSEKPSLIDRIREKIKI